MKIPLSKMASVQSNVEADDRVGNPRTPPAGPSKWTLTSEAFGKLLAVLDFDRERAGEKYEQIRGGLVCFFEWRGCSFPEDHADETLNRLARKIDESQQISDPFTYVYGIARMILLEVFKEREKERLALVNMPLRDQPSPLEIDELDREELRLACLEKCLAKLSPEHRECIRQYYQGDKRAKITNREQIAARMRVPLNALRLRTRRIREKLEVCVGACAKRETIR